MKEFNDFDLNLYNTFIMVAKEGSISKAANTLYVSQPAVSHSMKLLEEKLNCKLFNRTAKGIELTVDGNKLLYSIESAFNILDAGIKQLNDSKDLLEGMVKVGVPTHICTFFISDIIEAFNKNYPGIKFLIVNKSTAEMIEMLETRNLDVIIDSYPIDSTRNDITITDLLEIDNCFVASNKYGNLVKENKSIAINELKQFPLLLHPEKTSTRKALENVDFNLENRFKPNIEVATTEVMINLVKKGLGIGYFARMSVLEELRLGNLIEIPIKEELPKTKICVAYIEDFLTNAPKEFIKEVNKKANMLNSLKEKKLRLIVLQECMYGCNFCHKEGIITKREELLTPEDIKYMFKTINKNYDINTVHITGGEPLLKENLKEIIINLKKENAIVNMTTNGYLIKENMWIGELIDKLNISVYSVDKEKYENISKIKNSYSKTMKAIRELRFKYPTLKLNINTALIKNLNDDMEDVKELVRFSESVKASLKIIEISPNNIDEFISIDKIVPKIRSLGYKCIFSSFREQIYSNGTHNIILQRCTCSVVSEMKDKSQICKENNDIYITQDGKINLCRNSEETIDLYNAIKNRDNDELVKNIKLAYKMMGNHCKC